MSFTIQNVLVPNSGGYTTTDVQIVDDRIIAIAPHLEPLGESVDGTHKLLLPGFVNAHTHSPEVWQRGLIPPLPLELWIAALYDFPALGPEQVYLAALTTGVETLLSGGTSVVDHLVLIPGQELESIQAAARGYQAAGIRAFIAPLTLDMALSEGIPYGVAGRHPSDYDQKATDVLTMMETAIQQSHRPDQGVSLLVGPTGLQLCSDELLLGCIDLSDRYHLCRHTHLLETKAQQMLAYERFGHSAVVHLQQLGFLCDRTSLAHSVWLDDTDIAILAETQATVVHNPMSNLRLGSGIAPVLKYRQAGVNVAFGCDGTASSDGQDLLEVIKVGSMLHNTTDFDYRHWISPREAVEMAALGGAQGIHMATEMGSLTIGKLADMVLYDLTQLSLLPRTDPIGLLVMGSPRNAIHSVWVGGKRVVKAGQPTQVDMPQLQHDLFEQSQWQVHPGSPLLQSLEARYRQVMNLAP